MLTHIPIHPQLSPSELIEWDSKLKEAGVKRKFLGKNPVDAAMDAVQEAQDSVGRAMWEIE